MTMNYLDPERIRTLLAAVQGMLQEAQAASTRTENPVPLSPWAQKRLGLLSGLRGNLGNDMRQIEPTVGPGGENPTTPGSPTEGQYVPSRPTVPRWGGASAPTGTTLAERIAAAQAQSPMLAARRARLQQMLGGSSALAGIKSVMGG